MNKTEKIKYILSVLNNYANDEHDILLLLNNLEQRIAMRQEKQQKTQKRKRKKAKTTTKKQNKSKIIQTTESQKNIQIESIPVDVSHDTTETNWIKIIPENSPKYIWCSKRGYFLYLNMCPFYVTYACKKFHCRLYDYGRTLKKKHRIKSKDTGIPQAPKNSLNDPVDS